MIQNSLFQRCTAVLFFGLLAFPFAVQAKIYPDMGAVSRPGSGPGSVQIIPLAVDTQVAPDSLSGPVTVFADFKPAIFNGTPAVQVSPDFKEVVRGWYEAVVQINDPNWKAEPSRVPVYLEGMPIVSLTQSTVQVNLAAGFVEIGVQSDELIRDPVAFKVSNRQNISVYPANGLLDFSCSTHAVIRLEWTATGVSAPRQSSVGVSLDPSGGVRFASKRPVCSVELIPPVPVPAPPGQDGEGFVRTRVEVPASLPQPVVIAPSESYTVITVTAKGGLFFKDLLLRWNPELKLLSSGNLSQGMNAFSLITNETSLPPTGQLYFSVPAGVTPVIEVTAAPDFVPPGKKKTVVLSLMTDETDVNGNIIATTHVKNQKMTMTFVSDAPVLHDDAFAFRNVTLVLDKPLNVLENDVSSNPEVPLLIAGIEDRPDLYVSADSLQVLYTLPANADTVWGFTDSFRYTVTGRTEPAVVYVTVAPAQTRGDSVFYSAKVLHEDPLMRKPSFYGKYMPLNKYKLKKQSMKNLVPPVEQGALVQLTSAVKLFDQKARKALKYEYFADIADSVQKSELGLQVYRKVKGVKEKNAVPFAAWVVVPPELDTYRLIQGDDGKRYLALWCRYEGNKPKAFLEWKASPAASVKKTNLKVMRSVVESCTELRTRSGFLLLALPAKWPVADRVDLVIDSTCAQSALTDLKL